MDTIAPLSFINGLDDRASSSIDSSQSLLNQPQFLELISGMLASSSSTSASGSLGGTNMLTPLLLNLIEQMMSDQLHSQENTGTGQSSVYSSSLAQTLAAFNTASDSSFENSSPRGLPVHGPVTQNWHPGHNGIDFGVVVGTPAAATLSGKVVYAGWSNQGYGNLVIVQNGPYQVYYGHLSEIPVQVGQSVVAGQTIGLTGNTGHSTGPHLHYEVRKDGKPIDPTAFTLPNS
jgi:murein DD-endopeptidase MepM/ murein hydrolase activator NlpD